MQTLDAIAIIFVQNFKKIIRLSMQAYNHRSNQLKDSSCISGRNECDTSSKLEWNRSRIPAFVEMRTSFSTEASIPDMENNESRRHCCTSKAPGACKAATSGKSSDEYNPGTKPIHV